MMGYCLEKGSGYRIVLWVMAEPAIYLHRRAKDPVILESEARHPEETACPT